MELCSENNQGVLLSKDRADACTTPCAHTYTKAEPRLACSDFNCVLFLWFPWYFHINVRQAFDRKHQNSWRLDNGTRLRD